MSKQGTLAAPRGAPFAWLGPLAGFAEFGTAGYPRAIRRRLTIVNLMALTIAIFSVVYAGVFASYGARTYLPLIVVNIVLDRRSRSSRRSPIASTTSPRRS